MPDEASGSTAEQGRSSAEWLPIVYDELRMMARARMDLERADHTLQTTALVHEAYVRLAGPNGSACWNSRAHFFGAAAEAMRRILVEHARKRLAKRRGGDKQRGPLSRAEAIVEDRPESIIEVSDALERLAKGDSQAAEIVKLHCFAGFSVTESAEILGISRSTAYAHWAYARAQMGELLADD